MKQKKKVPSETAAATEPVVQPVTAPTEKPKRKKLKIDPILKVLAVLFVLICIVLLCYPLLKQLFPAFTDAFDNLRGVYTGPIFIKPADLPFPVFSDEQPRLNAQFSKAGTLFYFKPAVSEKYRIQAKTTARDYIDLFVKKDPANTEVLISNKQTRNVIKGDVLRDLDTGSQIEFQAQAGEGYYILVYAATEAAAGSQFTLAITLQDASLSLVSVLGICALLLVIIYGIRLFFLIMRWKQKRAAKKSS